MLERFPEILLVMSVDFIILTGLVLSLFVFYQYTSPSQNFNRFVTGFIFGLAGILFMHFPAVITEGVFLDLRLLPILLAAYLFGPVPALVAGLLIAGYRYQLPGIGLAPALASLFSATLYSMVIGWRFRDICSWKGTALIGLGLTLVTLPLGLLFLGQDGVGLVIQVAPWFFLFHTGGAIIVIHINLMFSRWRKSELEHQRLLEQIHMSDKMAALGQLTSGITHDINNDLTVISGFAQLISLNMEPASAPKFADNILQACERSSRLIQNLLIFARKARITPQPLELAVVIGNLLLSLRSTLGNNIEIHFENSAGSSLILADRAVLESAVLNLCINARDAMPEGGILRLAVSTATDSGNGARQLVILTVADSGCGMSETVKQHLFEPFFTTKQKGYGAGLGLSMVFGFVQQAQASIDVVSSPGAGTTIKILFPLVTDLSRP